jgi:hypothetical protein
LKNSGYKNLGHIEMETGSVIAQQSYHQPPLILVVLLGTAAFLLLVLVIGALARTWHNRPWRQGTVPRKPIKEESGTVNRQVCSLEIKQVQAASSCCLFRSKQGKSLQGNAFLMRLERLQRLGVLI